MVKSKTRQDRVGVTKPPQLHPAQQDNTHFLTLDAAMKALAKVDNDALFGGPSRDERAHNVSPSGTTPD
ncbi:hypothetical protein [Bradyrhizobium genosp. P]|uniref:hypothetical protein n=1 Tax=Bradyrhizobium genosp. P TaxID=83641 RepID=UPI003CF6902C